jgi:hypothetical protein
MSGCQPNANLDCKEAARKASIDRHGTNTASPWILRVQRASVAVLPPKKKPRLASTSRGFLSGSNSGCSALLLRSIVPCPALDYAIGLTPYAFVSTTLPSRR